jgi:hypothetical protein
VDWIHLAQDRDQWRVLGNTVTNIRVPVMELVREFPDQFSNYEFLNTDSAPCM